MTGAVTASSQAAADAGAAVLAAGGNAADAAVAAALASCVAFYAGRWKATLFFMILVPFFVSFVIRTIQWRFILGDNGLIFGPLKNLGVLPEDYWYVNDFTDVFAPIRVRARA